MEADIMEIVLNKHWLRWRGDEKLRRIMDLLLYVFYVWKDCMDRPRDEDVIPSGKEYSSLQGKRFTRNTWNTIPLHFIFSSVEYDFHFNLDYINYFIFFSEKELGM